MKKIKQIIREIFIWEPNVIKNLEEYDKKKKAKQQKSKVQNTSRSTSNN
jgi:hypothetical protein